ncbi:N-methyl-L-tryptophan oxidase [Polymorphobacter arshaanensis]|uniref:N-methyl-L-tryptophan oxidase n=1 Tax=Glacieibacterium arshaanense TaxID=2511025 RepID=A0A4Y9EPF9_9SPHN|nr:N-methyl-L-tryptophan oxidase [Polymorphobacter arshaanensis]TFU05515.1 N-methyl-L-tryptophan oxidase [Polymorphobacter arshaanensis]
MNTAAPAYDVAIVGLGAMGVATLYQLARRGVRAIGFDSFTPPHGFGSSHGETRITRQAIGEGAGYVPLVLRSHQIWDELEAATGTRLITRCGFLAIAAADARAEMHGKTGFVETTIAAARLHGIVHELPTAAEAARRFPQFALRGDETCYYEPGGGYVHPEACIAAQLQEAQRLGAALQLDTRVQAVVRDGVGVRIETSVGDFHAAHAVVAAGAWAGDFVGAALRLNFAIYRQVLHWLPVTAPGLFAPDAAPVFIWSYGADSEDQLYGFPPLPGATSMKCAAEYYRSTIDPDSDWRDISADEAATFYTRHVAGRINGVGAVAARSQACIYTVTPDGDFVIDDLDSAPVTLVSACSGHGFKHSAAIGEAVAQQLTGSSSLLSAGLFAAKRFASV